MDERPEVTLRKFEPGDAAAVHRWFNNRDATRTLVVQRPAFSMEEAEDWVRRAMDEGGDDRKYAILVAGRREPVGFTALYGLSRESGPELGALIGDEVRRGGIGRRAEALTIAKAFEKFGAHRVYGEIPAFNEAAKRTVLGLGWHHVETIEAGGERDGQRFDLEIWAVEPDDFRTAAAELLERGAERTSKSDSS
jgi:RimJ/RimL family protein N-acetyltransferase